MKNGILVFYINLRQDQMQNAPSLIETVVGINTEVLSRIKQDSKYEVMWVPTTNEACRVDKIDFDDPWPRYIKNDVVDVAEPKPTESESE